MGNRINIYLTADNIISALGFTTQENIEMILNYRSGITLHTPGRKPDISDVPVQVATVDDERLSGYVRCRQLENYSRLEQLFILSISDVLSQVSDPVDLRSAECCILFSTTKGNIDRLSDRADASQADTVSLWRMAERIAGYFHAGQHFRIISNACISGVSALVVAKRLIEQEGYRKVIVTGGDVLSHFITSGFISFKSVSPEICRPFDVRRDGLNLGEGCGTVLLTTEETPNGIVLAGGGISNDANHISGPSRTGDGLYYAIRQAMTDAGVQASAIDFVNTHGTATVYNDEMESKAIHLSGLQHVPVNSVKSYFGHTLGAAGVIETIICAHELRRQTVFGTWRFEHPGVPVPLILSAKHAHTPVRACVKTASGFGGCNAAVVLASATYLSTLSLADTDITNRTAYKKESLHTLTKVIIKDGQILVDHHPVFISHERSFAAFIREAYKASEDSNMKFYKMDDLCKLGYMAGYYTLKDKQWKPAEMGIILANRNASLHSDMKHQMLIREDGDTAASPAVFVYTLSNVVAGEICIRHKIQGENTFFIYKECNLSDLERYAHTVMQQNNLKYCIAGWCELVNDTYQAEFILLEIPIAR